MILARAEARVRFKKCCKKSGRFRAVGRDPYE
jgi:hypothetical protein